MISPQTPRSGGWVLPVVLIVGALASMILVGGGLVVLWGDKPTIFDHPLLNPPPTASPPTAAPVHTAPAAGPPHPAYPTPDQAGTHELFAVDGADRGPEIAPGEQPPAAPPNPSYHAHCEHDLAGLACGPKLATKPHVGWAVGKVGEREIGNLLRFGRTHLTVVVEREDGRLRRLVVFDGHGRVQRAWFFDDTGEVCTSRLRTGANAFDGCGRMRVARDARGHATKATCLQWNGQPMKDTRGVGTRAYKRDRHGLVTEERFLDAGGRPVAGHDGVHRMAVERDNAGRRTSERVFDVAGAPVIAEETGCHALSWEHDDSGQVIERRCLDTAGKLAADRAEVAIERYALDGEGCVIGERYLDVDEKAATAYQGVHALVRKVTPLCETFEERCLNEVGGLVSCGPSEPTVYRHRLDEAGQVEATRHHGADGGPAGDPEFGAFEVRYDLDPTGLRIEQTCFDETGSPAHCGGTGFHGRITKVDEAGREVEARFFDISRTPTTNQGTHVRTFRYDAYDHLIETRNIDERGRLIESMGNAITRYLYDDGHRLFAVLLQDRSGKPATYTGCFTGLTCPGRHWHAVRVVRSEKGRATQNLFFDRDRALVFTSDCALAQCWK